jgi:hypothetical protein
LKWAKIRAKTNVLGFVPVLKQPFGAVALEKNIHEEGLVGGVPPM